MDFYLDSGSMREAEIAYATGLLSGITTNPTLMSKVSEEDVPVVLNNMFAATGNDVNISYQPPTDNKLQMIQKATEMHAFIDQKFRHRLLIKLPCTNEGFAACRYLATTRQMRINMTLCFNLPQALIAAKSGAWCVSIFLGRYLDQGEVQGYDLVRDTKQVYVDGGYQCRVLAASLRSVADVHLSIQAGADIVTMPFNVFTGMTNHSLTQKGLDKFLEDANAK